MISLYVRVSTYRDTTDCILLPVTATVHGASILENHHFQYFNGQVLFATVIKNQTFYSDREVKIAATARHFMAKMGADTSKAMMKL